MRHLLVQDSDIIHTIGFEITGYLAGTLEVVFKTAPEVIYTYEKVKLVAFAELLSADSIGKSFHEKFTKTKFPFTKSTRTELDKIVGTRTQLKK